MKKISKLFFVFLLLSSVITTAQNSKNKKQNSTTSSSSSNKESGVGCFNESSKVLNIGIGFGGIGYHSNYNIAYRGYKSRTSPVFGISYEQALKEKIGPGFLGIGAYLGYQSYYEEYDYENKNYNYYYKKEKYKYMFFAARAAYHLDALNFEKGEVYFGAVLGLRYQSYSYETNDIDPYKGRYKSSTLWPSYSGFIGGRYYLAPKIAVYGEVGWWPWLTIGASFKL